MSSFETLESRLSNLVADDGEEGDSDGSNLVPTESLELEGMDTEEIEELLPDRADVSGSGGLTVEPISGISSEWAGLSAKRQDILRIAKDNPIYTAQKIAREADSSESYVRYTLQDFGFLLRNDDLFEYFVGTEDEEMTEDVEVVRQSEGDDTEESVPQQSEDGEADAVVLGNEDEVFDVVAALIETGRHDAAREVMVKFAG